MEMDNSLREAMQQMVNLQAQSLNVLQQMNQNAVTNANAAQYQIPTTQAMTGYQNYAASYAPQYVSPYGPQPSTQPTYAGEMGNAMVDSVKTMIFTDSKNKLNQTQRSLQSADLGARISNGLVAGVGGAVGTAGNVLPWFMGAGLLAPMAIGTGAAVGAGAVTSVMLDQMQQAQSYNKYLIQNSYKMINPLHSTNDKGVTGFGVSDRWAAASFLRHANTDLHITDDDISGLLKNFTEAGLMTGTSDLENFKKKFTQLTKYVKEASLTLSATYEETAQLMGELEKAGILSNNFDYTSAAAKIAGSYSGMNAQQALLGAVGFAQGMAQGTGMSAEKLAQSTMYMQATLGQTYSWAKDNDKQLYEIMSNFGGAEGSAQFAMNTTVDILSNSPYGQAIAYLGFGMDGSYSTENFKKAMNKINSGQISIQEAINDVTRNVGAEKLSSFASNARSYVGQLSLDEIAPDTINLFRDYVVSEDKDLEGKDLSDILSGLNLTSYEGGKVLEQIANPEHGISIELYKKQVQQEEAINKLLSEQVTLVSKIKDGWGSITDWIGDFGQGIAGVGDAIGRWVDAKFNGGANNLLEMSASGNVVSITDFQNKASKFDNLEFEGSATNHYGLTAGAWGSATALTDMLLPELGLGKRTGKDLRSDKIIKRMEKTIKEYGENSAEGKKAQETIDAVADVQNNFVGIQRAALLVAEGTSTKDDNTYKTMMNKYGSQVYNADKMTVSEMEDAVTKMIASTAQNIGNIRNNKNEWEEFLDTMRSYGATDSQINHINEMKNDTTQTNEAIAEYTMSIANVGDTEQLDSIEEDVRTIASYYKDKMTNSYQKLFNGGSINKPVIGVR